MNLNTEQEEGHQHLETHTHMDLSQRLVITLPTWLSYTHIETHIDVLNLTKRTQSCNLTLMTDLPTMSSVGNIHSCRDLTNRIPTTMVGTDLTYPLTTHISRPHSYRLNTTDPLNLNTYSVIT